MKYYTETIPLPLAEKLKDKGMPIIYRQSYLNDEGVPTTMYGQVFDWLMEKGVAISICNRETPYGIGWYPVVNGASPKVIDGKEWHHSANAAIEKALTLI